MILNRPDFPAIVAEAFDQIRREAAGDVHVTLCLLTVLAQVARRTRTPERGAAIRRQAEDVLAALDRQAFIPGDAALVRGRAQEVFEQLIAAERGWALAADGPPQ